VVILIFLLKRIEYTPITLVVAIDTNYIIFKNVKTFTPNKIQIAIEKIEKIY
jgi:hypothetical protein